MRAGAGAVLAAAMMAARALAGETPGPVRLSDQASSVWSTLPTDAADPRLTRLGDAPAECVAAALGEARRLLTRDDGARRALRELSKTAPGPRGAQVSQPLGHDDCGAFHELRAAPGGFALGLALEAGCGCTQGGVRVHLLGEAPLAPEAAQAKDAPRLRPGEPRYAILASCEPCAAEAPARRAPLSAADPCARLCAPLQHALLAWQSKAGEAAARLDDLAGQATTLEVRVTSDRRALDEAEARRSKTRAVMETIAALQARIKGAQAELGRLRQASQDAARVLSALRGVTSDTEAAAGRCRARCPAPADTTRASNGAGGGIGTGVLIAGGAAAAAGGALALSSGGGSGGDAVAAPEFSGRWHGTKVVISNVGAPALCRSVFDEDWLITQTGSSLEIAVDTIVTECGGQAACGGSGGCTTGPPGFRRRHLGMVSGSTAFVYPYPDYLTPECALAMTVQGGTLRGSFSACRTEQPLPVSMDVVLQRVTR